MIGSVKSQVPKSATNPKLMDTIETGLEQLHGLFMDMLAILRREKEELCTAKEHFEWVCAYACMHYTFLAGKIGKTAGGSQQREAERRYEGQCGWQPLSYLPKCLASTT